MGGRNGRAGWEGGTEGMGWERGTGMEGGLDG